MRPGTIVFEKNVVAVDIFFELGKSSRPCHFLTRDLISSRKLTNSSKHSLLNQLAHRLLPPSAERMTFLPMAIV